METTAEKRLLLRVIDPQYGPDNIYRFQAKQTISLGPVVIATVPLQSLPWLDAEVITENNYRSFWRKAPRDKDDLPDHLALQQERKADFVGISASISNAVPRALEIIEAYKAMPEQLRPKGIIVGGWHAGDSPEEFLLAGADVVVHGEAEPVIASLIEALARGEGLEKISGISYWSNDQIKRNPIFDPRYQGQVGFLMVPQEELDLLPAPNFGLVRFAKINIVPISRVRGCSGRCRFCRVKAKPRHISPERFAQQLKILRSQGWRKFFLVDDRSEEDLEGFVAWLKEIIAWRQERKVRRFDITAQCRLSLAEKPEVLQLMMEAGIDAVAIGYESPIPEELRAMRKPIKPGKMLEWTKVWQKHGFFIHMMKIFGYPMPPEAEPFRMPARQRAKLFWQFIKKANPDTLQVMTLTPILGTEDWDFLESQGRIFKELGWDKWDGLHVVFQPDEPMTPLELQKEIIWLQRKFYAFRYLTPFGWFTLLVHLIHIGVVTISMPFAWLLQMPLKGWRPKLAYQPWYHVFRNAKRRFQAHLIVMSTQKKLKAFEQKLTHFLSRRKII